VHSRLKHAALLLTMGAASLPAMAGAAERVTTDSAVYVERVGESRSRSLEPVSTLRPGDRIVTVLTWKREAPGGGFTLTNPMPRPLYYQGSANSDEEVSVDGGRSWGRLGALRLGSRLATPEDVTHLRWRVTSPGATGRIAYSAIVR